MCLRNAHKCERFFIVHSQCTQQEVYQNTKNHNILCLLLCLCLYVVFVFNCFKPQITFQEVPNEVSLAFLITGCQLGCRGCHSPDTWSRKSGTPLTTRLFSQYIERYKSLVTCALFYGGEWQPNNLIEKLKIAHQYDLKTCLYTGQESVEPSIEAHLDFLKTGPWIESLGGLVSPSTNQRFIDLKSGQCLNHLFQQQK